MTPRQRLEDHLERFPHIEELKTFAENMADELAAITEKLRETEKERDSLSETCALFSQNEVNALRDRDQLRQRVAELTEAIQGALIGGCVDCLGCIDRLQSAISQQQLSTKGGDEICAPQDAIVKPRTKSEAATLETDAFFDELRCSTRPKWAQKSPQDFACTLERQRNELQARVQELEAEYARSIGVGIKTNQQYLDERALRQKAEAERDEAISRILCRTCGKPEVVCDCVSLGSATFDAEGLVVPESDNATAANPATKLRLELQASKAECERLREDKERLDWLEAHPDRIPNCTWVNASLGRLFTFDHNITIGECEKTLREAIDAARKPNDQ